MREYINSILPRLKQFSESLDKKELVVEQPWVMIDAAGYKHQYIFKRDGKLILSLNGQVQIGTWEYIPAAKSLLIDRVQDKLLLNQAFFSEGIMILRRDGVHDEKWILMNERVIPDLDAERYIQHVLDLKEQTYTTTLIDGTPVRILNATQVSEGKEIIMDGKKLPDAQYTLKDHKIIYIHHGRILHLFHVKTYPSDAGILIFHQREPHEFTIGDKVFCNDEPISDGIHTVNRNGEKTKMKIKNGCIDILDPMRTFEIVMLVIGIVLVAVLIGMLFFVTPGR